MSGPALVAHTSWEGNGVDPSPTFDSTGATLLQLTTTIYDQIDDTAPVPTDIKGNTWILALTIPPVASGGNIQQFVYYAANPTVGTGHTVNSGCASDQYHSHEVAAYSGVATVSPLDQATSHYAGSGPSALTEQPGSLTPSVDGCLVITTEGNFGSSGTSPSISVSAGFTPIDLITGIFASYVGSGTAYEVQGARVAVDPTWTLANTTNQFDFLSSLLIFKPTPVAPTPTPTAPGSPFYAVELTAFLKAGTPATPAQGHGTTPRGTFVRRLPVGADTTAIIRASDAGYRTLTTDAGGLVQYPGLLDQAFAMSRAINLDPTQSSVGAAWGSLDIANPDGRYDSLAASWNSDGRPLKVLYGVKTFDAVRGMFVDPAYATLATVFIGMATPWYLSSNELQVPIRDATYWLDRNLQTNVYGGTGTYDGTVNLTGTPKPKARGGSLSAPIRNVTPVLIDPVNLIYQYTDAAGTVVSLYEGGATDITFQADTTNLYSGSTSPGQYRTDNSRGLFQLGSVPQRTITADVTGQFATAGVVVSAGQLARFLLTEDMTLPAANISTASFVAAAGSTPAFARGHGTRPHGTLTRRAITVSSVDPLAAVAGVWFDPANIITCVDAIDAVLSSIGAQLVPARDGTLRLFRLQALTGSALPVVSLSPSNCVSVTPDTLPAGVDPPPFRFRVGYAHNYTVQSSGISPSATSGQAQFVTAADHYATWSSTAILAAYRRPNDSQPVGSGVLLQSGDAQTVANALGALWGTRRRLYDVVVPLSVALGLEVGNVVRLTWPMDNLRNGQLGQIVGEQFQSQNSTSTFQVLV